MTSASALYVGRVTHRRLRPLAHALNYRVFWLLLDLSELDVLDKGLRLFSRNRFNLLSFYDRDHGFGSKEDLRSQVVRRLKQTGIDIGQGSIRLLTMPRVLGYVFNPISLYYCYRADGGLAAVIYEVTSTFGERHAYVVPVRAEDRAAGLIRQTATKALYVSPFMDMEMAYEFQGRAPAERLELTIVGRDPVGPLIAATMIGKRRELRNLKLLWAALAIPLMTIKVVIAIHWEALQLWIKGVPLTRRPARDVPAQ